MSWDWDAEDINPDKNNRNIWVSKTPNTIEEEAGECVEAKLPTFEAGQGPPSTRSKNKWVRTMYVVTKRQEGVVQASTPIHQVIGTPIRDPKVTIWVPSEWSRLSESSQGGKHLRPDPIQLVTQAAEAEKWKVWVMKNAPTLTSDMPRGDP